MGNPYRSPVKHSSTPNADSTLKFWQRFSVLLLMMVACNFARLFLTWRAYSGDGYEQIGFPFVVYERGGLSYSETIYWHWVVVNGIVAITIAYFGAHFLRDSFRAAIRKIRTSGQDVN